MTFQPQGANDGQPPSMLPAPGWFPDPQNGNQDRYWDGVSWTHHTRIRPPAVVSPPPVARLPERSWQPDPSHTHLERLWDGSRWTERTRDRITKIENPSPGLNFGEPRSADSYGLGSYGTGDYGSGPHGGGPRDWSPSTSPGLTGPRDWSPQPPPRRRALRAWSIVGLSVLVFLGVAVVLQYLDRAQEASLLAESISVEDDWVPVDAWQAPEPEPAHDPYEVDPPTVEAPPQTTPADVDYPVFGSTELVTHLEAGMIAQQGALDVSVWVEEQGFDAVSEALIEAGTQNPYLYVTGWETMQQGDYVEVRPAYTYDDTEAERRRSETVQAAAIGLERAGVHDAMTAVEKVTAINDYIVDIAVYDEGALNEIEQGGALSSRVHQSQEAYGILVDGTAVCNGYAMAFVAMSKMAGLDTVTVTGSDSAASSGASHAWNKVLIGDSWLLVDVTWNDPIGWDGGPLHDYLLLADDDPILETRTTDNEWVVSENLNRYSS